MVEMNSIDQDPRRAETRGDMLEPLAKTPALGTVNGIGLNVHGRRDVAEDGTYVTTRYFTFLFVPVIPIDAYLVADAEEGGRYFLAKVPLAESSRLWRRLVVGGAVAAAVAFAVNAWWSSPERRLAAELEEVAAAETAATSAEEREAVVAGYERLVQEYAPEVAPDELGDAAAGVVRLLAADVDVDFETDDVDHALRVVRRVESLPAAVRAPAADAELSARLSAWADRLDGDDETTLRDTIRLFAEAERFAPTAELTAKKNRLERRLADRLAAEWPIEAVGLYLDLGDQEGAHAAAGEILARLEPSSSVWSQLGDDVERWAAGDDTPLAGTLRERVMASRARDADESRAALLASGDEASLRRALAADPGDQDLATALAYVLRGSGRGDEARALLAELGPPGFLAREARTALATLLADDGRLRAARDLLRRGFDRRLSGYQTLSRRYTTRANELQDHLIARAEAGNLPPDLLAELEGKPDEEQQRLFGEWLARQLEEDPELREMIAAYESYDDVVPTALALGNVTLLLAGEAETEARSRLLQEAERVFLAIQGDAEGLPSYHLGLGQVYHRLGKAEEGERELAFVLDQDDDWLALEVAAVYRELGMIARAREVNAEIVERTSGEARDAAAISLAVMATDLDEKERWFRQANTASPFVRYSLLAIEADRLMQQNRFATADEKYAEIFAWEVEGAEVDATAANNAALTLAKRFACTGDVAHLDRAVALLGDGVRLSPDSALLVGNLGDLLVWRGHLRALEPWLDPFALRLDSGGASSVITAILNGPRREALLETLPKNPDLRRALDLARQQEMLGPSRPDGYRRELEWHVWREDLAGLRDLASRLERVAGIDTSRTAEATRSWRSGEKDDELRDQAQRQLERIREQRATLPAAARPATHAASWLLEAEMLRGLVYLDSDLPHARATVETLRQARETWPGIGADGEYVTALITLGILEAAETEPEVARVWREGSRQLGWSSLLAELVATPRAAAALRARPELERAAGILAATSGQSGITSYYVGRLVDDDGLIAAGRGAFGSELKLLAAELEARLSGDEQDRAYLVLLRAGPDAGPRTES